MPLTEDQITLVQDSFRQLRDELEPRSKGLYKRLFALKPALRKLFHGPIEDQAMHYMTTLGVIVDNLGDSDVLTERYTELAEQHKMTGISRADFEVMEEALIGTLRENLGEDFTDEMEEAWTQAYRELAEEMMEVGGIV